MRMREIAWTASLTRFARMLDLAEQQVYDVNVGNGWFDEDRTVGDDIALLHSEVSEMLEAFRSHGLADATVGEPAIDKTLAGESFTSQPKPEGFGSECADVLIRLLDTCRRRGVNLAEEFDRKLEYNRTRGHRHGGKLL